MWQRNSVNGVLDTFLQGKKVAHRKWCFYGCCCFFSVAKEVCLKWIKSNWVIDALVEKVCHEKQVLFINRKPVGYNANGGNDVWLANLPNTCILRLIWSSLFSAPFSFRKPPCVYFHFTSFLHCWLNMNVFKGPSMQGTQPHLITLCLPQLSILIETWQGNHLLFILFLPPFTPSQHSPIFGMKNKGIQQSHERTHSASFSSSFPLSSSNPPSWPLKWKTFSQSRYIDLCLILQLLSSSLSMISQCCGLHSLSQTSSLAWFLHVPPLFLFSHSCCVRLLKSKL